MERAIATIVPGQRALEYVMSCGLDGGRIFASALAWLLAIIYAGSALSRLRLAAGIIRIERATQPDGVGERRRQRRELKPRKRGEHLIQLRRS